MNTSKLTSEEAMNLLKNVPEEWQAFWCNHGTVLRNLADLSAALADMSAEEFAHHVNGEKNDFATWTEDVLGDATLANKLRLLSTAEASQRMVARRIEEATLAAAPADAAPVEAAIQELEAAKAEAPAETAAPAKKPAAKKAAAKKSAAKKAAVTSASKAAPAKPAAKKQSVWSKLLKR
ncbi:MAG TPA: hypothetical protein VL500_02505 [Candidatus Eisenbacteria bacterium]|nr:hypothetical protein [Candidatus Eisenbacteria bacterium]